MTPPVAMAYRVALGAHLALFFVLFARIIWLAPPASFPRSLALLLTLGPLLLPLRGMLRAIPYTLAWSSFLALWYFTLGVFDASAPPVRWLGVLEALLAALWFAGALLFVRWNARSRLTDQAQT